MKGDYYALLGVEPDADLDTIKRAYRKKAAESHPDRGGTHRRMLLLNEAWETLSDAGRRRLYDERRAKASSERRGRSTAKSSELNAKRRSARRSRLAEDFARAPFNHGVSDELGCPEAGTSISGQVFVLLGIVGVGFILGCFDVVQPGLTLRFALELVSLASLALVGARVGSLIHLMIGQWIGNDGAEKRKH